MNHTLRQGPAGNRQPASKGNEVPDLQSNSSTVTSAFTVFGSLYTWGKNALIIIKQSLLTHNRNIKAVSCHAKFALSKNKEMMLQNIKTNGIMQESLWNSVFIPYQIKN